MRALLLGLLTALVLAVLALSGSAGSPAAYADRLGATPSLYGQRVGLPLDGDDLVFLRQFARQAASQGAVASLAVEPQVPLAGVGAGEASDLSHELDRLSGDLDCAGW